MTKEQILTIVISATVSAVVSSFAKPFTEKIFAAIMPDTKKIISFMKKAFFFILRYGPTTFLIIRLLFLTDLPFDKFWVLQFCIQFFILGIIVSFDISFLFFDKHFAITKDQSSIIGDLAKTAKGHNEILQRLAETTGDLSQVTKEHFGITKKLLDKTDESNSH